MEFSQELLALAEEAEVALQEQFRRIERIAFANTNKVMDVFRAHHVSDMMFGSTSGYGYDDYGRDALDKIWADVMGAEAMDDFSFDLVQDGLREALSAPAAVFEGDVEMTEKLAEGLIMSGFAMQALQSSRPASGIEHQFSHCWDMENLCHNGEHVSHGFKVGIGTLASTAILEYLLEKDLENLDVEKCVEAWKSLEEIEECAKQTFAGNAGLTARALEETRNKYVDKDGLRKQLTAIKESWPTLKEKIRAQIIPFDEVYANLKAVGAPYEPEMIGVSRERFRKTLTYMPYMRSRITAIDVLYRCGMIDEVVEHLFGKGGHWEVE